MKKKYLYNGQLIPEDVVTKAAQLQGIDFDTYVQKAGMKPVEDSYTLNGQEIPSDVILEAANKQKLGFDDYLQKAGFEDTFKKKESSGTPNPYLGGQSQSQSSSTNGVLRFRQFPTRTQNNGSPFQDVKEYQSPQPIQWQPASSQQINEGFSNMANKLRATTDNTQFNPAQQSLEGQQAIENQPKIDAEKKQLHDEAVDNSIQKYFKNKGITAPKGSALYNQQKAQVENAINNGIVQVGIDPKTGERGLYKTTSFWQDLKNGWNESVKGSDDAANWNNWTTQQQIDYLDSHESTQDKNSPFLGSKSSYYGSVGKFIGGSAPTLGKTALGALLGATLVAAAGETGGMSLEGIPAATAFMFTAPDMINQSSMNEQIRAYYQIMKDNPNISKTDAMEQAHSRMWAGGTQGLLNAALMTGGQLPNLEKGISAESKGVLLNAFDKTVKPAINFGLASGGLTAATEAEGNLEGVHTDAGQIFHDSMKSAGENATQAFLLGLAFHAPTLVPAVLKNAAKFGLVKNADLDEINKIEQLNEDNGNTPQGTTQQVMNDLSGYKQALDKTPDSLSPDTQAQVAGLIQKKDNIQAEADTKDEATQHIYQNQIDGINDQIKKEVDSNDPYKHEVDNITGNTYAEELKNPGQPSDVNSETDYQGQHILAENKTTADNLSGGGTGFDWDKVAQDHDLSDKATKESYRVLKSIKDNPDAEITIYRSVPKGIDKINEGDWVTLSKTYAKEHGQHETDASKDLPVISMKVKAKDIAWDGNDLNEFAYQPKEQTPSIVDKTEPQQQDNSVVGNPVYSENLVTPIDKPENVSIKDIMKSKGISFVKSEKQGTIQESVKKEGVKVPIIINKDTGEIIDGTHRFFAAKDANKKTIPVIYVKGDFSSYSENPAKTKLINDVIEKYSEPKESNSVVDESKNVIPNTESNTSETKPIESNIAEGVGNNRTIGISHERLTKQNIQAGGEEPEMGEYLTPEEHADNGRKLLNAGQDPNDLSNLTRLDDKIDVARAHLEDLAKIRNSIGDNFKFGLKSDEYKKANKEFLDYSNNVVKKLGSESGSSMTSLQGERNIDTGSFTSLVNAMSNEAGRELTSKETGKLKEISDKYNQLKKDFDELKNKANNVNVEKTDVVSKGKNEVQFKKYADDFRKAFKQKEFNFKDDNGNDVKIQKSGLGWNDLVEIGAKAIEKTGKIIDGINEIVDKIKDEEWYKKLTQNEKNRFSDELTDYYKNNSETLKRVEKKRKMLSDIQMGKVVGKSKYYELSDEEKNLDRQINEERTTYLRHLLYGRFLDKKDNVFSPKDAKDVWSYINKQYLDKNIDFDVAMKGAAADLGLSVDGLQHALGSSVTMKNVTDEMYRNQYRRNIIKRNAKLYILAKGDTKTFKIFKAILSVPRGLKVFGHGTIPMETHVGMSKFDLDPAASKLYFQHVLKTYKLYGSSVYYEKAMQTLISEDTWPLFNKVGLHNDPDITYEDYLLPDTWFKKSWAGKLQEASRRGFDILKVYRQAKMQYYYDKLSQEEKSDINLLKEYANIVNHETGSARAIFRENSVAGKIADQALFAQKLETARWASLHDIAHSLKVAFSKSATTGEKRLAKMVLMRGTRLLGAYMGGLLINNILLSVTGSKQRVNWTDPTKGDFLDYKVAGKSIGLTGGMLSLVRFLYSIPRAIFVSKKELHNKDTKDAWIDYTSKYVQGKLSPLPQDAIDVGTHHDYNGNTLPFYNDKPIHKYNKKLTWREYSTKFLPIPFEGMYDNMKSEMENNGLKKPDASTITKSILSGAIEGTVGTSIKEDFSTKEKNVFTDEDNKYPSLKYFIDKGHELPNTSLSSEKVTDKKNMREKAVADYSKEIQDSYVKLHTDNLKSILSDAIKKGVWVANYKDKDGKIIPKISLIDKSKEGKYKLVPMDKLSYDEQDDVLHIAQSEATTKTKNKLFYHKK